MKNAVDTITPKKPTISKKRWKFDFDNFEYNLMGLPAILFLFVFNYLPMFGVVLAFKNYKVNLGILKSPWVGFQNFKFFFESQDAFRVTSNTIILNGLFIVSSLVISVVLALFLFEINDRVFIKTYQTVMILPNFLSWVVIGYMTYAFLNPEMGFINALLQNMGVGKINWYSEPKYWRFILTFVHNWRGAGIGCVIYYAALIGIDKEYFEAAFMDGANKLQSTWYISIPFLVPLMTILTILNIGNIFRADFGMFYNVTRDSGFIYPTTDVIDTYIFRALREVGDMGMGAAVGLFQSLVGFVLIMVTNHVVKKIEPKNALF